MMITSNYINTGLITRNYDVINTANKLLVGKTIDEIQDRVSGTMRELSEEEVKKCMKKLAMRKGLYLLVEAKL